MTLFYILLLVLALLISGFGWSNKLKRLNAPFSWFFIYVTSILIGFRSRYSGVDTTAYYEYFNNVYHRIEPKFTFEPGFTFLTNIFTEISNVEIYIFFLSSSQLIFLYLSSKTLKIDNKLLSLVLFLSFVPGFDLITNGLRGGVALSLGLILLVATVINHNRLAILNFSPALIHASYMIIAFISLFTKFFSSQKMNKFIFICSLIFFALWLVVSPLSFMGVFQGTSREVNSVGRLIRYLIIEKELMSLTVKLYFMLLSIFLSSIYFFALRFNEKAKDDNILTRMAFITLSVQFVYALFSFSEYSYRFMFLAFPLQVLMFSYILDKYFSGTIRSLIVFSVCLLGIISTYSTKTFSSFILLDL